MGRCWSFRYRETGSAENCSLWLLIYGDNREATAMSIGKSFLYFNRLTDKDEVSQRIIDITPIQIMDVASLITLPNCSTLIFR